MFLSTSTEILCSFFFNIQLYITKFVYSICHSRHAVCSAGLKYKRNINNIQARAPCNKAYFTEISRDVITDISHVIGHISEPLIVGFLLNSNYLVFHEILSFHRGLDPAKFFFYPSIIAASNLSNKYFCYNLIELPTKIQQLLALQLSSLHNIIRFICQISAVFVKSISIVHHGYAVTAQVIRPPALFLFPQVAKEMCRKCLICQLNK